MKLMLSVRATNPIAPSTAGTTTRKNDLNGLIDKILDAALGHSRDRAKEIIAKLLDDQANVNRIVPQIKVTERPGIPSDVEFTPAAIGTRKIDGKLYTVFNVHNAGFFLKPHEDGRTLSDDEIQATLDKWNAEAKDTLDDLK